MPISAEGYAVDTSVAVAAIDGTHAAHGPCRDAVRTHRPSIAGHAAFETYSVLTRMPGVVAVDGPTAAAILDRTFPDLLWMDDREASALLARCGPLGIVGGAVYDALVGEVARLSGRRLLTRDQRARRTYDLLGVDHELVGLS
jgi:hypothetical protein